MKKIIYGFVLIGFFIVGQLTAYAAKREKVIICGVGKNIAHALPNMVRKIEELGANFLDYQVIVYENNSTDNTAALLKQWAKANKRVLIISETVSDQELFNRTRSHAKRDEAPCRMELIAYGRNQVLKRALSEEFEDFNFLIMTDMDFTNGWQAANVIQAFSKSTPWDCITANGVDYGGTYYDRYAYRDDRFILGPEVIGEDFWSELGRTPMYLDKKSGLKRVYSAFGGLAIYRKECLFGCTYSGYVTPDYEKFMHFIVSKRLPTSHPQYGLYLKNTAKKSGEATSIFQANCGYDGPAVCEHSTLHATMFLQGFDKIYVDPNLLCRY